MLASRGSTEGDNKATRSLVAALRQILATKPYQKVTVQDLCDNAFLSRRTFYKHFNNKDDVIAALIAEDFLEPAKALRSVLDLRTIKSSTILLSERIYQNFLEQAPVYRNLLENMGRDKLLYGILDANYHYSQTIFSEYDFPADEMDYAAYIMAAVTATTCIHWMKEGFKEPAVRMAQLYSTWMNGHWRELGFTQK
jgi:AcrR family transcriptional regulator